MQAKLLLCRSSELDPSDPMKKPSTYSTSATTLSSTPKDNLKLLSTYAQRNFYRVQLTILNKKVVQTYLLLLGMFHSYNVCHMLWSENNQQLCAFQWTVWPANSKS